MAAKDRYHQAVKIGLQKEQWTVTDPFKLDVGGTKFEIDLGAERLLAADRSGEKSRSKSKHF